MNPSEKMYFLMKKHFLLPLKNEMMNVMEIQCLHLRLNQHREKMHVYGLCLSSEKMPQVVYVLFQSVMKYFLYLEIL